MDLWHRLSEKTFVIIVPVWIFALIVSATLFRINAVSLSLLQVYLLTFGIFFFYGICGILLYMVSVFTLDRLFHRFFPESLYKNFCFAVAYVPAGFIGLYVLDMVRFGFFVTRTIPRTIPWFILCGMVIFFLYFLGIFLFGWLGRGFRRIPQTVLIVFIVLSLIMLPYFFWRVWITPPFHHQATVLSSRPPVDRIMDSSLSPTPENYRGSDEHIFLFGTDGATWNMLLPLMKMGHCPTMNFLFRKGSYGNLNTIIPTLSPVIWTSIATGMLPDHHEIQHFARFHIPLIGMVPAKLRWPEHTFMKQMIRGLETIGIISSELYSSVHRKAPTFYEIFSSFGEAVGVANWWCSWPVQRQNGFIISERFSYSIGETILQTEGTRAHEIYPPHLEEEYRPRVHSPDDVESEEIQRFMPVNSYEINEMSKDEKKPWFFSNWFWLRTVHQSDRSYFEIGFELYKKMKPRIFSLYHQSIDVVEHHYWHYLDPTSFPSLDEDEIEKFRNVIPATYDYEDFILRKIIAEDPMKTVIIVSDHGMLPTHKLPKSGDHVEGLPAGIILAAGGPIRKGKRIDDMSVVDVTPLLCTIAGFPISKDMDGRVPVEMLQDSFLINHPIQRIPTYGPRVSANLMENSATDSQLFDKLKGLGYLQ